MELTLKTDLSIGQRLYYLASKSKTIYAPYPTCNNERKVTVEIGGESFTVDCPKCTGKATKGDTKSYVTIEQHSVDYCHIKSFRYGKHRYGHGAETWRFDTSSHSDILLDTLREDTVYGAAQLYTDEAAAKSAARELNKAENAKRDEFLASVGRDRA
jgi:hypothetical protein